MKLFIFCLLMSLPLMAMADDITIFDVRKNLPMSDDEKVFRDFYINAGNEAGLSVGMVITVQRRLPLYDSYSNRSAGDLQLQVAKIKIIHVQKGLAVARLHSEFTREGAPILEDNFIMVGDRLDLATATTDKGDKGKKAESAEGQQSEPVAAVIQPVKSGQILINSVELSSEATKAEAPVPNAVETPILQ